VARAGDLVPIRIPGTVPASVADMPPLVPIVRSPPAPVAIRSLPGAPVAVQRPVVELPLPPLTAQPLLMPGAVAAALDLSIGAVLAFVRALGRGRA
jgi:hypothetical protein